MRNIDRFILQKDDVIEAEIKWLQKRMGMILKAAQTLAMDTECLTPGDANTAYACANKGLLCLESAMKLLKLGYVGSATALYRQVYEFLLIVKLAADVPGSIFVQDFFAEKLKFDTINDYIKKNIQIIHETAPSNYTLSEDTVINFGKDFYSVYSAVAHATTKAQQNITPSEDFYDVLMEAYIQWILLLEALICATGLYYEKILMKSGLSRSKANIMRCELINTNRLIDDVLNRIDPTKSVDSHSVLDIIVQCKWTLKEGKH